MIDLQPVMAEWPQIALWSLVATAAMTTVLEGAQLLGVTRISLPFLFGTFFTAQRARAILIGYVLYMLGGWAFGFIYGLVLRDLGATWWIGTLLGLAHGLFLIAVLLPLLPFIHPRLASDYDGPEALTQLEPPGPFGLNYGRATPVSTVLAQGLFGLIFGLGLQISGA